MKNPIFAALDLDNDQQAMDMAKKIAPFVGGYKVGPRLCIRYGMGFISELAKLAPVFLDNKYYDIPNTMEAAVRACFDAGASYTTIHAGCGIEALQRLAKVEAELNSQRPFKLLAVTVLTSFSEGNFPPHWQQKSAPELVSDLAATAIACGISGLVCSAHEVADLRQSYPDAFLVTPGIRMSKVSDDDQKRVVTPDEAIKLGASALVVGRPIIAAQDPVFAAQVIAAKALGK